MEPEKFAKQYRKALKFGAEDNKHGASEVLPAQYVVVQSRATQNKPDRVVSKHTTLGDAWVAHTDLSDKNKGNYYHLYAVYPDRSAKVLPSGGEETGAYHETLPGNGVEHSTDRESLYWKPFHDADAAPISLHRLAQRALVHSAIMGTRGRDVVATGVDTRPGSTAHSLAKSALDTGDFTPILALADHLQEQGLTHVPNLIRKAHQKFLDKVEDLKWSRLLRS